MASNQVLIGSATNSENGHSKRFCVYVLLSLRRNDFNGFNVRDIWKALQFEEVLNRTLYEKRVYVGRHELVRGEEVHARRGHLTKGQSAIADMPDADEWLTFDWVAFECSSREEMKKMESFLFFYCKTWTEINPLVRCINRMATATVTADDIERAYSLAKEGRHLATYMQGAARESSMDLEFAVPENKFKEYRR